MRFSTQAVLAVALAQYAAAQTTHAVSVGEGALVFNPETVTAAIGDKVTFEFYPRNHSVVQSAFDAPLVIRSYGPYLPYPSQQQTNNVHVANDEVPAAATP